MLTKLLRGSKKLPGVIERNLQRIQNGERLERQTLIDVYAAMLSPQAPFVLLIEDMHEASTEQLEFWNALCQLVTRLPGVAIIQTSRVAFADPVENIALEPLSSAQSKTLLEHHLNAQLPRAALEWIDSRCAGNPLFTMEFADFLTRHDALWNDGKTWKWREPTGHSIPNTVEAILAQWLANVALTSAARVALETKAYFETRALGQVLDDALWAKLSGLSTEQILEAKAQLEAVGVLSQTIFAHPLYREVTAQYMSRQQLEQLALSAVKHFELHNQVLILPFLDEAELDRDVTLELLEGAANQAQKSGDAASAGRLLARATEFAEGERKGALALQAAKSFQNTNLARAFQLAEQAAALLPNSTEALLLMADFFATQGRTSDLHVVLNRLPESMKQGAEWVEKLVMLYRQGNDDSALMALLQEHPELEHTQDLRVVTVLVGFLLTINESSWALRIAERGSHLDRADLSPRDRIQFLSIQAKIADLERNILQEEELQSRVIDISVLNNLTMHTCQGFYRRGFPRRKLGKEREAVLDFENSLKIAEDVGHLRAFYSNKMEIGMLKVLNANFIDAEKNLLESKKYFERYAPDLCLLCCQYLILLYELWNIRYSNELILRYSHEANYYWNLGKTPIYYSNLLHVQSKIAILLRDAEKCLNIADELIQGSSEMHGYSARAQALVLLKRSDEAVQAYQQALIAARADSELREEQVIGLELDNLTRDSSSARERLEWFKSRGLNAYVQLAQRYFPELLETTPPTATANLENSNALEVLGQMRIQTEGKTAVVRGQKRQELLALLLHARMERQSEVPVDDLRETLYPDQSFKEGSNALRQTIHKTRSSYGQQVIVTTSGGYALGRISSDAETFLEDGNSQLWRDTYLNGLQLDGADAILENLNLRLSTRGVELLEHNPKEATRIAGILLASNPYDLEALRLQCLGLRQMGQHAALKRKFQAARASFIEIGEHLPETWAQFLDA